MAAIMIAHMIAKGTKSCMFMGARPMSIAIEYMTHQAQRMRAKNPSQKRPVRVRDGRSNLLDMAADPNIGVTRPQRDLPPAM